ncbi:MAG: NADH-quinone oxidoreductase subunit J [Gemmataceae bacterium]
MQVLFMNDDASVAGGFWQQNWPVLVVSFLGFLSIYLLLPRPKRFSPLLGGIVGVMALIFAGVWLLRPDDTPLEGQAQVAHLIETILFYVFSGIAIVSGVIMITQTVPVRAALSFAVVILSTCGLFLLQAAPFLMAATITVYAGAIVVTFLFVIMLAQQSGLDNADFRSREPLLAALSGFVLLAGLLFVLQRAYVTDPDKMAESKQRVKTAKQLAEKIHALQTQDSLESLKEQFESDKTLTRDIQQLVTKLSKQNPKAKTIEGLKTKIEQSTDQLDEFLLTEKVEGERGFAKVKDELGRLEVALDELLLELRSRVELVGSLRANTPKPVSQFSGTPSDSVPPRDATNKAKMPSHNVQALGRSLFTDYLVAVEMVAMLLLVATIGAIAISARRKEGL